MKILTVVGARPQFIKAATVSRVIRDKNDIQEVIVHTGQHYDSNMSQVFFDELDIPKPHYNLEVGSGSHGSQTGLMLDKIEQVILKEMPDKVLVYGDTNSTLAGALAATKLHIPVAHVEAGLRSFNKKMPEEVNRVVVDHVSDMLFAPTETALKNLHNEGLFSRSALVGDVMYDSVLFYLNYTDKNNSILFKNSLKENNYILCTLHRAENTDNYERLSGIVVTLNKINKKIPVFIPLHPRTKSKLRSFNLDLNVTVIDPVGYLDMLLLIKNSKLVMTDSGGLQKEAYFCGKYCVTLRDETEWVELVEHGYNKLVDTKKDIILDDMVNKTFLNESILYGNGDASHKILKKIMEA